MNKRRAVTALSRVLTRASSSTTSAAADTATQAFPLKHVTKSNFSATLASLKHHLRDAAFVAIDLEMTGVTTAPWRECLEYDRFDVQYLKVKDSAENFAAVQFGVCPFLWDPLRLSFVAIPHNFFLFPSADFLCQTTSLDFLAQHQFDFNTCIRQGISYLSKQQEEEARERLKSRHEDHFEELARDVHMGSVTDLLFSERMKSILQKWREGLLMVGSDGMNEQQLETVFYKMRPAVALKGFTPHQLRVIRLITKKHFKDLVYVRRNDENSPAQQLVVYTESENDKHALMGELKDEYYREAEMKITDAIGFRHVVDLLSSEKKLIIGHNCFLDFAHIYNKFFGALPSNAEEFVSSVNKYFPYVIDTKILLNSNSVLQQRMKKARTSLSSAFATLCSQIAFGSNRSSDLSLRTSIKLEVQVDDMRSFNWISGVKHEAGYDAFMTGCIFAQACSYLGIEFKLGSPCQTLVHNENLQKYLNLVYLSWINGDIIDMSTGNRIESPGPNNPKKWHPKILFENIVLIWGFPCKLKAAEIKGCISKVFGPTSVVSVYHVDETAVFVRFSKSEFVSDFLILKESLERNYEVISALHPLAKLLEGGNTSAASYETYKEICSSSISKFLLADQAEAMGISRKTKLVEAKVEAQTQKQQSSSNAEQDAANAESVSVEKRQRGKKQLVQESSGSSESLCAEVIDCLYTVEVERVRATNL